MEFKEREIGDWIALIALQTLVKGLCVGNAGFSRLACIGSCCSIKCHRGASTKWQPPWRRGLSPVYPTDTDTAFQSVTGFLLRDIPIQLILSLSFKPKLAFVLTYTHVHEVLRISLCACHHTGIIAFSSHAWHPCFVLVTLLHIIVCITAFKANVSSCILL